MKASLLTILLFLALSLPFGLPASVAETERAHGPTTKLAFFSQPGCRKCRHVKALLAELQRERADLEVRTFSMARRHNRVLLEAVCFRAGVEQDKRLIAPAVFVGERGLVGEAITRESLVALVDEAAGDEGVAWEVTGDQLEAARDRLIRRFRGIGIGTVLVGGLLDGINPCAFATLVFFVGYLAMLGRSGREVLAVGGAFTAGVFTVYFLTGLGLSEVVLRLEFLPVVGKLLTAAVVVLSLTLAGLSFADAVKARRGQARSMTLKLPTKLRRYINWLITRRMRTGGLVPAAGVTGMLVSVLEFVCTGQVYLPIIQFMTTVSVDRTRTVLLLLIYNVAFVLPLVWIFLAAYKGVESDRLRELMMRNLGKAKLALGVFFAGLAGVLVWLNWTELTEWSF